MLAYLVGPAGMVHAVEKVPELVEFGSENCRRIGVKNVRFHEAGSSYGWPRQAPYDRILVSAAATKMPPELLRQLKVGGRLVIPVRNTIHIVGRAGPDDYESTEKPGFAFVPLV